MTDRAAYAAKVIRDTIEALERELSTGPDAHRIRVLLTTLRLELEVFEPADTDR